ncbi:hypothetical protein A1C_02125 [Rickettsia akari str. Hartford]|uniref:Uncharacterized protein n=1 Tax=Rickettsia akari (strain Hartford) TaxID=293614 RepID=A8GMV7_RICAH|nr:hypothetical protein A1C_02125 [Rickettsia akari str. Hartford]
MTIQAGNVTGTIGTNEKSLK